jgi:hypothetical protein
MESYEHLKVQRWACISHAGFELHFRNKMTKMDHSYAHYNLLSTTVIIIIITQNANVLTQCNYLLKPLLTRKPV